MDWNTETQFECVGRFLIGYIYMARTILPIFLKTSTCTEPYANGPALYTNKNIEFKSFKFRIVLAKQSTRDSVPKNCKAGSLSSQHTNPKDKGFGLVNICTLCMH